MSRLADALRDPLPLVPNRISRFYGGGRLLDAFRGAPEPHDDDRPEDWVGSATAAWAPPGRAPSALGPSSVELDGQQITLPELLEREPEALVGSALLERAGPSLGVLVKLLDAAERLPVHCHPSREHAARLLGSRFGKAEAWLVLGTHDEAARVWAGFRQPVERAELLEWIEGQQVDVLLEALVEHTVRPGDALLVPAGTPHAIGAGVFLLELQEPTDFSIVAGTEGLPIESEDASLRFGWGRAVDFFDRSATGQLRQPEDPQSASMTRLIGPAADPFFRALRMGVSGEAGIPFEPSDAIGVVLAGSGVLVGARRTLALAHGVTFALPAAAVPGARIQAEEELELVWCLGPQPDALDRQPLPALHQP